MHSETQCHKCGLVAKSPFTDEEFSAAHSIETVPSLQVKSSEPLHNQATAAKD
jgi:hypothetical protein